MGQVVKVCYNRAIPVSLERRLDHIMVGNTPTWADELSLQLCLLADSSSVLPYDTITLTESTQFRGAVGALGKRTVHQVDAKAQLVVRAGTEEPARATEEDSGDEAAELDVAGEGAGGAVQVRFPERCLPVCHLDCSTSKLEHLLLCGASGSAFLIHLSRPLKAPPGQPARVLSSES